MEKSNPREINTTSLAFLGDAVYEIYVREYVLKSGELRADKLHRMAVKYVCADGQAKALKSLMNDFLTEEEIHLVKKARNRKTATKARSADAVTYKLATAFEALLGFLYLDGQTERLEEIVFQAIART